MLEIKSDGDNFEMLVTSHTGEKSHLYLLIKMTTVQIAMMSMNVMQPLFLGAVTIV